MTRANKLRLTIRRDHAAAVAVGVMPLVYFLPALVNGRVLCEADGLVQNVPFRVAAAQMMRSGNLPLWNPYIFGGMPLFATAQVGILYPLNWFYLPFSPATATNLMVIASYIVAGLGAYFYARQLGSSIAGAAVTSLVWQIGGAAIGQIGHINVVQTAALLPWVLWSIDRYVEKGNIKRGAVAAIIIAVQFFAGHQQAFVNSLLLVIAYVIVMAIANHELRRRYLTSFAFIGTGLLLAAIQILPTLELLRHSERSAATYEFFTSFSMPKRFVFALVAPYIMGGGDGRLFRAPYLGPPFYPEMVGYVGLATIMLVLVALMMKRDVRTKFWAVVAVICLFLAFGEYAPLGLYKIIYHVPLLNLFRVPARHLMEVDFALAVLAGRGLTVLATRRSLATRSAVVVSAVVVFVVTIIAVTWLRPSEFHLARPIAVTLLRAPELFLPIVIAGVSAVVLWMFAQGRRGAAALVLVVLFADLAVWGQFSSNARDSHSSGGWFVESPHATDDYFHEPETVKVLNTIAPADKSSYRILTAPHYFDPAVPPVSPSVSHSTDWNLWTQPDVYMMHGIQNAAGYDGFGLERYSQFAGRMKVWGELTDADATLRGDSREIDLTNARYLLSMRHQPNVSSFQFENADARVGDVMFTRSDLGLPSLSKDKRLTFSVPPINVDRFALITNLAWSENAPDNTTVARLRLQLTDGRTLEFPLRAGTDTAEWSYDRADIRAHIQHQRAAVATSYKVDDAQGSYDAHTYVTTIALPARATVRGGDIINEPDSRWPDLTMTVFRMSLIDQNKGKTYALARNMFSIDSQNEPRNNSSSRWKLSAQTEDVDIYETAQAMPRAWLASQTVALNQSAMLDVIRNGRFADGEQWNPLTTALIESTLGNPLRSNSTGQAQITRYEPNRIDVTTNCDAPSILILSENHYPGWRAYVDGQFVDTLRVDYNLRGVTLSAGAHNVEFVYRPKSVIIGFAISLLTLLGLVVSTRVFRTR